jgi:hypothetical protein
MLACSTNGAELNSAEVDWSLVSGCHRSLLLAFFISLLWFSLLIPSHGGPRCARRKERDVGVKVSRHAPTGIIANET